MPKTMTEPVTEMSKEPPPAARARASAAPAPVVTVEHLAKTYVMGFFRKKVHAVRDVSLEVMPGEIFGFLGPNGAGKTTTLKVLMDLIRPTAGTARLFGLPAGHLAAKKRLGYLPENPYFYEYLTGKELMVFMAKLHGCDRQAAWERARDLLDQVGLTHAADLALRRYSKGMLQRIGLAQALINDPELVILDEPMSGLDPLGRKDVRELIASLREQGKTVMFSSHILSDVELLADRVAIIARGRTVDSGTLDTLLDARVVSTEIVVQGREPALVEAVQALGHEVVEKPDGIQIVVTEEDRVQTVLDVIREQGGTLRAMTPRKESLEDLVVKKVQGQDA